MRENQPVNSIRCCQCHAVLIPKAMVVEMIAKLNCPRCKAVTPVMVKKVQPVRTERFNSLYGATVHLAPAAILSGSTVTGYD